ncbi:hypothetical protein OG429_29730 [Streptomyces sp. NBC_00190]|uniref:hypothetical protein n=1 Tax=unclassified Streptomyces TaxID=2593676 RepID=UPI002E2AB0E2|nr:hypothetical protein [Streptomyces sp. NBC_00190]WSZ43100.1 hypothetical protein OG239_32365 [Streptomyces sp. NBC_00868]
MRRRLLGFAAAVIMAALGTMGSVAQAAVPGVDEPTCTKTGGKVQYDSDTGLWICVGGKYDDEPIN